MAYLSYLQPSTATATVTRSGVSYLIPSIAKAVVTRSVKLATVATETNPYTGAIGANGGLAAIVVATTATEKNPYIGDTLSLNPQTTRPTSGQLWPRGL